MDRPFDRKRGESFVGDTPWSAVRPLVADMTAAELDLRYRAVTTYPKAVKATSEWLVEATRGKAWPEVLPRTAEHMADAFDYESEDAFIKGLMGG